MDGPDVVAAAVVTDADVRIATDAWSPRARPEAADRAPALGGIPVSVTTAGTTSTSVRTGIVLVSSHRPNGSEIRIRGRTEQEPAAAGRVEPVDGLRGVARRRLGSSTLHAGRQIGRRRLADVQRAGALVPDVGQREHHLTDRARPQPLGQHLMGGVEARRRVAVKANATSGRMAASKTDPEQVALVQQDGTDQRGEPAGEQAAPAGGQSRAGSAGRSGTDAPGHPDPAEQDRR